MQSNQLLNFPVLQDVHFQTEKVHRITGVTDEYESRPRHKTGTKFER